MPRSHDATQDDEFDAGSVEQRGGDIEGVRDDGETAVDQPPGQLEGRRAARDRDGLAVLDQVRGRGGDRPFRGQSTDRAETCRPVPAADAAAPP